MAATKRVIVEALDELVDKELDQFIWQLCNPMTEDIKPIPRARLQTTVRHEVVDRMVQQYSANAGNIAVKVLQNMKQNDLAIDLERKLKEVQQPEQVDGRNAPVFVCQQQPIQSDWKRPDRIILCTQEFKNKILRDNRDDVYLPKNKSQRKGLALLITNIHNRPGAERDEENMEWLLTALGYNVEKHRNLSGKEIKAAVVNFAALPDHKDSDSTFVVIMSHGNIIKNKDAILGAGVSYTGPDDYFFVDDIFTHLNSVNCPALIDKPKVILIQACRGENSGAVEIQSDAAVHIEKDFVSFKSTLPDIVAYRNRVNGSYFICYILEVFCDWAHSDEIKELFRKVTSCMEKDTRLSVPGKLMPCVDRMTLPKKLYLFPGL
ncbi:caspase b-like [Megalobrama amblycephala]|uniref:caspase b-like n=1 Tax=Megalobrama amblycephala TaxID=75352 RepID=UPI002013D289|nr:caspase b-like [Megalobrama amblycephala]XP_048050923.1 caspase b-like [Megalobrama amblycephala]XP_048050925.1 caspase b-like [Megalobrama amblycephala]XP_048050926.1 caspase b-like [Megalobrama amblycephala]